MKSYLKKCLDLAFLASNYADEQWNDEDTKKLVVKYFMDMSEYEKDKRRFDSIVDADHLNQFLTSLQRQI